MGYLWRRVAKCKVWCVRAVVPVLPVVMMIRGAMVTITSCPCLDQGRHPRHRGGESVARVTGLEVRPRGRLQRIPHHLHEDKQQPHAAPLEKAEVEHERIY